MQRISLLTLLTYLHTATLLASAVPLTLSILRPRTQFCANAPFIKAGTFLPRRTLPSPPLHPRKSTTTILWCAPHSSTYIILSTYHTPFANAITALLTSASTTIGARITRLGDGLVEGGGYSLDGEDGLSLVTWDTNNHQQTYGVLGAAVSALMDFMRERGVGEAIFSIFDGGREVGMGILGGAETVGRLVGEDWSRSEGSD